MPTKLNIYLSINLDKVLNFMLYAYKNSSGNFN